MRADPIAMGPALRRRDLLLGAVGTVAALASRPAGAQTASAARPLPVGGLPVT
jgi:hypothetical protein